MSCRREGRGRGRVGRGRHQGRRVGRRVGGRRGVGVVVSGVVYGVGVVGVVGVGFVYGVVIVGYEHPRRSNSWITSRLQLLQQSRLKLFLTPT